MLNTLYINGCSLACGVELFTEEFKDEYPLYIIRSSPKNIERDGFVKEARFNIDHSYTTLLAKALKLEPVNEAEAGNGNFAISTNSVLGITRLLETKRPDEIFALICWSHHDRRALLSDYGRTHSFSSIFVESLKDTNPKLFNGEDKLTDAFLRYHHLFSRENWVLTIKKTLLEQVLLANFLERVGVRYLFVFAFSFYYKLINLRRAAPSLYKDLELQLLIQTLAKKPFFFLDQPEPSIASFLEAAHHSSFIDYTCNKGLPILEYGHPGTVANNVWMKEILNHLYEKIPDLFTPH